jgi:hypothetical protein
MIKDNILIIFYYAFLFLFLIDYLNTIILIGRYGIEIEGNMLIVDAINGSKTSYIVILLTIIFFSVYITSYIIQLQTKLNNGFKIGIPEWFSVIALILVFLFELINVYRQVNILL